MIKTYNKRNVLESKPLMAELCHLHNLLVEYESTCCIRTESEKAELILPVHKFTKYILDDLKKDKYLIVDFDGKKITGYAFVGWWKDQCVLNQLFVLEEYRGRGVGKELFNAVERLANGKSIVLNALTDNVPAMRFYLNNGFTVTEKTPLYTKLKK